jgi:hypothetical protein
VLKRFILWDYPRASWQYDVMVGLILAFIFLTPRELFRDQPRPKDVMLVATEGVQASYWIEPELLQEAESGARLRRVEELIHKQVGGKNLKVLQVEPVFNRDNEIRGYFALTQR